MLVLDLLKAKLNGRYDQRALDETVARRPPTR
jgi:hypothetical protein